MKRESGSGYSSYICNILLLEKKTTEAKLLKDEHLLALVSI